MGRVVRVGGWLAGFWLLWRLPAPDGPGRPEAGRPGAGLLEAGLGTAAGGTGGGGRIGGAPAEGLSVVIPARNEAARLPHLLRSLEMQRTPADEVIVVDDHSTDGTGQLARRSGARVLTGAPLPDGWTGKTWACAQGAAAARGGVLCFLDADVTLAPDALDRLRSAHARRGGLVSVQPFHVTRRGYESLSAVCNVVELMGTGSFTARPRRPTPMAFGPCLLIGSDDYDRIGGHTHPDVRPLVAEDIGLATRCAAAGIAVTNFAGRDVVAFRMYPGGVGELVEGWSKMLAFGASRTSPPLAAAVGLWVTAGLVTVGDTARRRPLAGVAYVGWAAQLGWMLHRVGRFRWWTAPGWPVPLCAFVALCGRSAVGRLRGKGPAWRGRIAPPA